MIIKRLPDTRIGVFIQEGLFRKIIYKLELGTEMGSSPVFQRETMDPTKVLQNLGEISKPVSENPTRFV